VPSPQAKRILLVDGSSARDRLRAGLVGSGFAVVTARDPESMLASLSDGFRPDVVVIGEAGSADRTDIVAAIREREASLSIVVVGATGDDQAALRQIEGVRTIDRRGAAEQLDAAICSALEANAAPDAKGIEPDLIVGSAAMETIRELIDQVADTDVPVLITGESGVGKGVIARAMHRASNRAAHPFVKVNCAALPDQLLESELFGYERGAFTGADRNRPGKFELADGGTILLDEIGEISAGTQAKLLQVLQDGCYYRLGGNREIRVDARVVASTNRDLEEELIEGTFRKDLFYRLNVVRVEVPTLRERREEIPLLAAHFVDRYEKEYGRTIGELPAATLEALARHDWPGNVRELENVVRRMVVLEDVDGVVDSLGGRTPAAHATAGVDVDSMIGADGSLPPLKEVSRLAALEVEAELIRRALERTSWNRRKAAGLLDISYKALLYKIRDCGITAA